MSTFRLPSITGRTEAAQLEQIKKYLFELTSELNFAMQTVQDTAPSVITQTTAAAKADSVSNAPISVFNSIKALIIKSADIVNAYYDEINHRLEGIYVAESEFGAYAEQTTADIKATSTSISQMYESIQSIVSDVESVSDALITTTAHINTGLLYYDNAGIPVYGLEIGQRTEDNGVEVFNKYARFTSDRLSFFDSNDREVAYISDRKLYITDVEIIGSLTQGGYVKTAEADGGVVERWVGIGG